MIQKVSITAFLILFFVGSVAGTEFKQFSTEQEVFTFFNNEQHKIKAVVSPFEQGGLKYRKFMKTMQTNPREYLGKKVMIAGEKINNPKSIEAATQQLKNEIKT